MTENSSNELESVSLYSANKGEWSEFYTFCYLLKTGILKTADKNLNPNSTVYLPIIKIIRDEDKDTKEYYPNSDEQTVKIYINTELVKTVSKKDFEDIVSVLYERIKSGDTDGPNFQSRIAAFMDNIHCTKIKAKSTKKEDIVIQLHDAVTNQSPIQGFSIKSYIGNKPTLLNAGRTTNFTFKIVGCTEELMQSVNSIDSRQKIVERIQAIYEAGCELGYSGMDNDIFRRNLQKSDSLMPQIMAEMLRLHYTTGVSKLSDVADMIEKDDPLKMDNPGFYVYKMKTVLCAFALGMIPSEPWNGIEDANGGYIVVKEDGDVVCFFLYDRNVFEDYLLENTMFERASTTRHAYMETYKKDNEYYIKLNLQIRFTKPKSVS